MSTVTAKLKGFGGQLLGRDDATEFMLVVAAFATYGLLDAATRLVADVHVDRLEDPVLFVAAVRSNGLGFAALLVGLVVAAWRWPKRLWSPWSALENGNALRLIAAPLILLLAWAGSLYEFNYLLGQSHSVDRLLVASLGFGCLARPALLVPFALQSRVIGDQFDYPFETTAAQNVDELLIIALLGIAAIHVLFVVTGRNRSAPVILILAAALATHFYIPGKSKLALGWVTTTDFANLPLSSYTAGWRGQGDGSWAERMSRFAEFVGRPGLAAALAFELGSVIAVMHYRLLRLWLPLSVVFHALVFAFTGFWFLPWVVFEIVLVVALTRPGQRRWLEHNATPARALLAAAAVVLAGSTLFHPPALSWLDAPISYGYRVEATGDSGVTYSLPASSFAPLEQELAFLRLRLGPDELVNGGYGAVVARDWYATLQEVETFSALDALATPADPFLAERATEFLSRFMDHANSRGRAAWSRFARPDHFWTNAPGPTFNFDEPIQQLDVYLLTALHSNNTQQFRRQPVLTLVVGPDGRARPS